MQPAADHTLPRSSPENQGIPSPAVLRFVEALERQANEMHSFMLLRHGSVVAEGWWAPYRSEHPHQLFSLSKSFTSTAVGLAVAEGLFSPDDPVLAFFPEVVPDANGYLPRLRVRHLLSMTTGHAADTWANMVGRPDGNWIRGFFEVPLRHEPGTHFLYNTGATYLLSAIVQKTSGVKLNDYLAPRLYAPLGIQAASWTESPQGITTGGIGLSLRTEAVARFGQLYLQKGVWQGSRLLPEGWVAEATTAQVSNGADTASDWSQGYGYQFWRCRHGAYRGDGVFGQYCVVMPEQDAVLAMTGGMDVFDMQRPLDLLWEILLPAMHAGPLPTDEAAQQALAAKCSSLALPPVQGNAASPLSAQVSGRTYTVDENELRIAAIALNFASAGCTLRIHTAAGEETIPVGYRVWQPGQTTVFNDAELNGQTPVFASGAWTADDSFTLVIRLVETPFYYTWVFHFAGDELLVESRINVSLDAPKTLLLSATSQP
jgi:CubicO group peptidase (beta-lactamase class C family)